MLAWKTFTYYTAKPTAGKSCVQHSGRNVGSQARQKNKKNSPVLWVARLPLGEILLHWVSWHVPREHLNISWSIEGFILTSLIRSISKELIDRNLRYWQGRSHIRQSKSRQDCAQQGRTDSPHPSACQILKLQNVFSLIAKCICQSVVVPSKVPQIHNFHLLVKSGEDVDDDKIFSLFVKL